MNADSEDRIMKRQPFLFVACVCLCSIVSQNALAGDWLHWRGPDENGTSTETNLPDKFSLDPNKPNSNLLWKAPYGCRSTPLIMNGVVYIINDDGPEGIREGERVMAFDAQTGKVLWEHKFNVFHCDIVSNRVGWTNLAADPIKKRIYAHGTQGFLMCLDATNGKVIWQRSLTEEFGRITGYGGRIVSPTVDGDLVIVGMINSSWGDQGRGGNRYLACNKDTGEVVWWSEPTESMKGTYYSNPIIKNINGQRLLITGAADGSLVAMQARTGRKVWSYPIGANVINTSPVSEGNLIYCTHGEENRDVGEMGRIVCVDAGTIEGGRPKLVWEVIGIKAGLASPLIHDGRLYVPDDSSTLHCFDAKTGEKIWRFKYGRINPRGSPVWADGKIYIADVDAHFKILKDEGKRCKELHDQFFRDTGHGPVEVNSTPAVSDGKVVFGTRDELFCISKKGAEAPRRNRFSEEASHINLAVVDAGPATLVQVTPADVVLAPGESASFKAHLFDKNGNLIGEAPAVQWSLPTPPKTPAGLQPPPLKGAIENGKLTVAKDVAGQQGYVDATVNGITGRARVRVAPRIPYKMDFEKVPVGATPGGWINAQGKFVVVEQNGNRMLKKLATSSRPPLSRANAYMTLPGSKDYIIEADVSANKKNNNLPDMGIVNSRYALHLGGNKQHIRLSSWEALPRVSQIVPFAWKEGEWYRCKLVIDHQGDQAIIRGKVWPRDQKEPDKWTVEATDPRPNFEGSPALYGYATGILDDGPDRQGAEVFYDNVIVTPVHQK